MNSNRKNSYWILIAILLSLQIYIGEQQVTSCPSGQFLAPVGASNTAAKACVEQKYFVYDADYYTASPNFVGTCISASLKISLAGDIYQGCLPAAQYTYLCASYARTANLTSSTGYGVYVCSACQAPYKFIVPIAAYTTALTGIQITLNTFSIPATPGFVKACTLELMPNCLTYTLTASLIGGSGTYSTYLLAVCSACVATVTTAGTAPKFTYANAAIDTPWATAAVSRLGIPCPLATVATAKACDVYKFSADKLSYDCSTCAAGLNMIYQKGAYNQRCDTQANYKYYDPNCKLYDDYDLVGVITAGKTMGNCIQCKDPVTTTTYTLKPITDTTNAGIVRNACLLNTDYQLLQPCSSYSAAVAASTGVYSSLACTGCPGGYTLTSGKCVPSDRYIPVPTTLCTTASTPGTTDLSAGCGTCATISGTAGTTPFCTTFVGAVAADNTKNQWGTRCLAADLGKRQIVGTFTRTDTGTIATSFACVNTVTGYIDACLSYRLGTITYGGAGGALSVATIDTTYSCDLCATGYTRVLSQTSTVYMCIKDAYVDKNCATYFIQTLACQACVTGSVSDPSTGKCKAPQDYTANCANAKAQNVTDAFGNVRLQNRCLGCNPTFTLIRNDDAYTCVPSVIGCSNFTNAGVCTGCASTSQQLVGNLCVALPLNCKNVASNGTCLDCNAGFIFSTATSACLQVAASGSNTLVACPDGQYFDSNGVCVVGSIANCLRYTISGASIKCSSCKTGYHTSNFGAQCDLDDPALAGVKCQDQPAGDSYIWFKSPQSGACLKKDKHCGSWSYEDLDNKIVSCSTCDDPKYYVEKGRCYQYDTSSTNTVANN